MRYTGKSLKDEYKNVKNIWFLSRVQFVTTDNPKQRGGNDLPELKNKV